MTRFLVDRMHVDTPMRDVALNIAGRAARGGFGPEHAEEFIAQALQVHAAGRRVYAEVVYRGAN